MQNYEPLEVIGSGSFGLIRKCRRKSDGAILAWKEIDYRKMTTAEKRQLVSEVNILRDLKHPNIVRYYERIVVKENCMIYIVMEFCEAGDLSRVIRRCKREDQVLSEEYVWDVFAQLVQALDACHYGASKHGVILHRDIKPENVLIHKNNQVKLGDFGLSRVIHHPELDFAKTYVGTPYYMSPQHVSQSEYNVKGDIWALACLVYELCALNPPFEASSQKELNQKIQLGQLARIPISYSDELNRVIKWMLQVQQDERPTTKQLLALPRIQNTIKTRQLADKERQLITKEQELSDRENQLKLRIDTFNAHQEQAALVMRQREEELMPRRYSDTQQKIIMTDFEPYYRKSNASGSTSPSMIRSQRSTPRQPLPYRSVRSSPIVPDSHFSSVEDLPFQRLKL